MDCGRAFRDLINKAEKAENRIVMIGVIGRGGREESPLDSFPRPRVFRISPGPEGAGKHSNTEIPR